MAIIAFDFDGTITLKNEYPKCGNIRPGIAECIERLKVDGHQIIIFTCRSVGKPNAFRAYSAMLDYLEFYRIPYDIINDNLQRFDGVDSRKPFWDVLVDDSSLGFKFDWDGYDIYDKIIEKLIEDGKK